MPKVKNLFWIFFNYARDVIIDKFYTYNKLKYYNNFNNFIKIKGLIKTPKF